MPKAKEPHRKKRDSAAGEDKHIKKDSHKKRKEKRKISDVGIEGCGGGEETIPIAEFGGGEEVTTTAVPKAKEPHRKKRDSAAGEDKHTKKDSHKKRKQKRKISDLNIEAELEGEGTTPAIPPTAESKQDKSEEEGAEAPRPKKQKRSKKSPGPITSESTKEREANNVEEGGGETPKPAHRFIVFIGNLPYTTTHQQLQAHFSALQPASIRLINKRESPDKCKGFAFLEFTSYDRMKSCLAKYHHSIFMDRKINVELTAGGGGAKSKGRREKLRTKNERLNDQRKRRVEGEEKLKEEKRAKRTAEGEEGNGGIHPSRHGRVKA